MVLLYHSPACTRDASSSQAKKYHVIRYKRRTNWERPPHNNSHLKSHASKNVRTNSKLYTSITNYLVTYSNVHTLYNPPPLRTTPHHTNTNTRADPNFRVIHICPLHAYSSTQQPPPRRRPSQTPAERAAMKSAASGSRGPCDTAVPAPQQPRKQAPISNPGHHTSTHHFHTPLAHTALHAVALPTAAVPRCPVIDASTVDVRASLHTPLGRTTQRTTQRTAHADTRRQDRDSDTSTRVALPRRQMSVCVHAHRWRSAQRTAQRAFSRNRRCSGYTARPGPARGDTSRPGRSVGWYALRSTAPNTAPHRNRNRTENGIGAVSGKTITHPCTTATCRRKKNRHTHTARYQPRDGQGKTPAALHCSALRIAARDYLSTCTVRHRRVPTLTAHSATLPWRLAPIVGRPTEIPARGPRPEGTPVIT